MKLKKNKQIQSYLLSIVAEKQTSPVLSFVRLIKLNWLRRSQILQKHEGGTHIGLPSQSNMESGLGWSGQ